MSLIERRIRQAEAAGDYYAIKGDHNRAVMFYYRAQCMREDAMPSPGLLKRMGAVFLSGFATILFAFLSGKQ